MKGKILKNQTKQKARGTVSVLLALSLSPLAALAQSSDSLTNSTLPMAQPAPSQFVQKIWGSLDIRKAAKKTRGTVKADSKAEVSAEKKVQVADASVDKKAVIDAVESTSTASGVTTSGQTMRSTPADNLDSDLPVDLNSMKSPAAPASPSAASPLAPTSSTAANTDSKPAVSSSDAAGDLVKATEPTEVKSETVKAAEEVKSSVTPSVKEDTSPVKTDAVSSVSVDKEAAAVSETEKTEKPIAIANALISLPPGSVLGRMQAAQNSDAVVVDNDEVQEVEETIKQEEIETDEGKTKAKAGARFPVVISSQITSKTAKKGDQIQARLKYDLKIGDRVIAKKGAMVNGHVNYSLKARTIMHSLVSKERWYRNSGCVGIAFDEIINEKGEHLPLAAVPSRQARIVKNKAEGRELGVNHYGQVTGPWAQQLRYKALRIGLNAALAPAGVFTFGAMPVALGVLGAANPSFAFSKPVGLNVRHRRLKGFAWGFLSGVPGSWIIEDTTVKGQEAIIKPGDEFYAEFTQEFTGEPGGDASLMPGASTKLRGEVLTDPKKAKKPKK